MENANKRQVQLERFVSSRMRASIIKLHKQVEQQIQDNLEITSNFSRETFQFIFTCNPTV